MMQSQTYRTNYPFKKKQGTALPAQKKKILFYVERNLHLPFLEPVHDYMAVNTHHELAFSSPPYKRAEKGNPGFGLETGVIRRLKRKSAYYGVPEEFGADITVVADACFYPVRNCGKIIDVGHGLISKGFFYKDAPIVRRENLADVICVPGEWHKSILEKNVFVPIRVSGFIKTDNIYNFGEIRKKEFLEKYGIAPGRKIILYAPTFNDELSSIPCIRERIAELTDDQTVLLVKLHGMTAAEYIQIFNVLSQKNKNIKIVGDDDFAGAMVSAHMMVSDVSSAYVEFMLMDKPVVLYNNPLHTKYERYDPADIEYRVRDALIEVDTVEELKLAVKLSLADPDEYGQKRRAHAKVLSESIDGCAAKRVSDTIEDVLTGRLSNEKDPSELFSIIYHTDRKISNTEVDQILDEIAAKNNHIKFEVIFAGPNPWLSNWPSLKVGGNVITDHIDYNSVCRAVEKCRGEFVVLLDSRMVLHEGWITWMHNYFRYHRNTAAVKALSSNENYGEILNRIDADSRPEKLSDVSEYFFYCLMGNDLSCEQFDADCLMLKKEVFNQAVRIDNNCELLTGLAKLNDSICRNGGSCWYALEIFAYQDMESEPVEKGYKEAVDVSGADEPEIKITEEILEIIKAAKELKKNKKFHEAINELNRAEELIGKQEHRIKGPDPEKNLRGFAKQKLIASREYRKNKDYSKAIELLEEVKYKIRQEALPNSFESTQIIDLLKKSRLHRKNKEYQKSIELLEHAKLKIA